MKTNLLRFFTSL